MRDYIYRKCNPSFVCQWKMMDGIISEDGHRDDRRDRRDRVS